MSENTLVKPNQVFKEMAEDANRIITKGVIKSTIPQTNEEWDEYHRFLERNKQTP